MGYILILQKDNLLSDICFTVYCFLFTVGCAVTCKGKLQEDLIVYEDVFGFEFVIMFVLLYCWRSLNETRTLLELSNINHLEYLSNKLAAHIWKLAQNPGGV